MAVPLGRGLVVVRLGAAHCISGWLSVPKEQRKWDLALSLYEEVELGNSACVEFLHNYPGGKWNGIHAFFAEHPHLLSAYDYFWLVDDDIEASPQLVDALFDYVRAHDFELAQPALTLDSYCSYRLTLQCPGFLHRYTNFVELMAPVLTKRILESVLPLFADTLSGWGIDWYWHRLVNRPDRGVAIIDAIAVGHRRPLGLHLRGRMKKLGINPFAERQRLARKLNLFIWLYPVAFAGVLENGHTVTTGVKVARLMTQAYWSARKSTVRRPWKLLEFPLFFFLQVLFQKRIQF